jgi:N-acetylmuramoyl-L-alanine amidase
LNQSLRLSSYVEEETSKLTEIHSRGVKQAGFLVLWKTSMPSILIETGFLTNPDDRGYLKTEDGQWNVANGIYNAIVRYKKHIEKK